MNKFLIGITVLIIVSTVAQSFLPWWVIIPIGFVTGMWYQGKIIKSYFLGFIGIFFLWFLAASLFNALNGGTMAPLLGNLFGNLPGIISLLMTGLIGGLIGGLSVLSGTLFQSLLDK